MTSVTYVPNIINGFDGIKIEGARLDGSSLSSINCSSGIAYVKGPNNQTSNSMSFTIIDAIRGWCNFQLTNPKGNSNFTGFEVTPNQTSPTANVIGTPTLKLTYDSMQKESLLLATFKIAVTAGNEDLKIYSAADIGTLNNNQPSGNMGRASITSTDNLRVISDEYGNSQLVIPAGKTANLLVSGELIPKILFAGTYTANLRKI